MSDTSFPSSSPERNRLAMYVSLARSAGLYGDRELSLQSWSQCVSLAFRMSPEPHQFEWLEEAAAWLSTDQNSSSARHQLLNLISDAIPHLDDDVATYRLTARRIALRIPDSTTREIITEVNSIKQRYLAILESNVDHIAPLHDIGVLLGLQRDRQVAIELLLFVRNLKSRVGHPTHPYTVSTTVAVADFQMDLGLYSQALTVIEESLMQIQNSENPEETPLTLINELRCQEIRALWGLQEVQIAREKLEIYREGLEVTILDVDQLLKIFQDEARKPRPHLLCTRCYDVDCQMCGGSGCVGLGQLPLSLSPRHLDDPGIWCASCIEKFIFALRRRSGRHQFGAFVFLSTLARSPGTSFEIDSRIMAQFDTRMSDVMTFLSSTAKQLSLSQKELFFSVRRDARRNTYFVNEEISEVLLRVLKGLDDRLIHQAFDIAVQAVVIFPDNAIGQPRRIRDVGNIVLVDPENIAEIGTRANNYFALGRYDEALLLQETVLRNYRSHFPDDHPRLLSAMASLALTYSFVGRYDEALLLQETVLASYRTQFPYDHPDLLRAMRDLVVTYYDLGRHDEALALQEIVSSYRAQLPDDHPDGEFHI